MESFSNTDTGSILGSDEGGATALTYKMLCLMRREPLNPNTLKRKNEGNNPIIISSDGQTIKLRTLTRFHLAIPTTIISAQLRVHHLHSAGLKKLQIHFPQLC